MKFGVVVFPGSNCDYDAYLAIRDHLNEPVEYLWHDRSDLQGCDAIILPGGFSYGDYLRVGAIASHAPIMDAVKEHVAVGGLVVGICNGFQVLCEARLLPGALIRNQSLRFSCRDVYLRVETAATAFSSACQPGEVLKIPINHGEGNFTAAPEVLDELESTGRVVFRYCDRNGAVSEVTNPNGSRRSIAGIVNERGNVLGMMPHPERAVDPLLGGTDGMKLFESMRQAMNAVQGMAVS